MNALVDDPATAAIMRGLCDVADRARDEVRFHNRDWWKERCRYRLLDLGESLGYAVRGEGLRHAGLHPRYEVCWLSRSQTGTDRLELIAEFDDFSVGGEPADFAQLVHLRAVRKLWLKWDDTLADAHRTFALLRRRVLEQDPKEEHAVYLFASIISERKRLHYSLLRLH